LDSIEKNYVKLSENERLPWGGIVPSDKSLEGPAILGEIPINSGIVEALVFSDNS